MFLTNFPVNVSKPGGEAQGIYNGIEIDFSMEWGEPDQYVEGDREGASQEARLLAEECRDAGIN